MQLPWRHGLFSPHESAKCSHCLPEYPAVQLQVYPTTSSMHEAPFKQGLLTHRGILTVHAGPVNP